MEVAAQGSSTSGSSELPTLKGCSPSHLGGGTPLGGCILWTTEVEKVEFSS